MSANARPAAVTAAAPVEPVRTGLGAAALQRAVLDNRHASPVRVTLEPV